MFLPIHTALPLAEAPQISGRRWQGSDPAGALGADARGTGHDRDNALRIVARGADKKDRA